MASTTTYQNLERIAILKNDIAGIDEYTDTYSNIAITQMPDFLGGYWFYQSNKPLIEISSQLTYILTLEEELDEELSKPLKRYEHTPSGESKQRAGCLVQAHLRERILKIDDMIKSNDRDPAMSLNSETVYANYTNALLIKRILVKRLKREQRKNPTLTDNRQRGKVNEYQLRRKIAFLEASHTKHMKEAFHKEGDKAILQSNYLLAVIQYYKDELDFDF